MKFSASVITAILSASSVIAAPAPEADSCNQAGGACYRAKRAAEAFAEALASSPDIDEREAHADFANAPGGIDHFAKRAVDELAAVVALSQRSPVDFYSGLKLSRHFLPDSSLEHEVVRRDAEPECSVLGQPCLFVKRAAEADANAEPWCTYPGMACGYRRDVAARSCDVLGGACWKARRAANAVLEALAPGENVFARDFNPDSRVRRDADPAPEPWCTYPGMACGYRREAEPAPEPWCTYPGMACGYRRDAAPSPAPECGHLDDACWAAKRDIAAMENVARSLLASLEDEE